MVWAQPSQAHTQNPCPYTMLPSQQTEVSRVSVCRLSGVLPGLRHLFHLPQPSPFPPACPQAPLPPRTVQLASI